MVGKDSDQQSSGRLSMFWKDIAYDKQGKMEMWCVQFAGRRNTRHPVASEMGL